jgi:hypothetical protein
MQPGDRVRLCCALWFCMLTDGVLDWSISFLKIALYKVRKRNRYERWHHPEKKMLTQWKEFCGETATKSNLSPQIFRCNCYREFLLPRWPAPEPVHNMTTRVVLFLIIFIEKDTKIAKKLWNWNVFTLINLINYNIYMMPMILYIIFASINLGLKMIL